jgi:hypothetical protein
MARKRHPAKQDAFLPGTATQCLFEGSFGGHAVAVLTTERFCKQGVTVRSRSVPLTFMPATLGGFCFSEIAARGYEAWGSSVT